ncbi:MAG: PrgI family protein [Candidatus Paceibacterota bacterium]
MQFQVPQFIEIEDKIVGPLTLKQFIYIAIAALASFLFFFLFELWLWLIITVVVGTLASSFAFIKVNGRPFIILLVSAVKFTWQPKFYIWKKEETKELLPNLPDIKVVREKEAQIKPLENLWDKLNTTTQPIKLREKGGLKIFNRIKEPVEQFEVQRKLTGERRVYKRVDYR